MKEKMRKIQRQMAIYMGVTLSFCLSLFGNATSGNFTVPGWIISFILSCIISLIIGWFVPMKTVSDKITGAMGLEQGKGITRVVEALISDIIYTPIITFAMILLAYRQATAHGGQMPFVPVFIEALIKSLIVGLIIIFILIRIPLRVAILRRCTIVSTLI